MNHNTQEPIDIRIRQFHETITQMGLDPKHPSVQQRVMEILTGKEVTEIDSPEPYTFKVGDQVWWQSGRYSDEKMTGTIHSLNELKGTAALVKMDSGCAYSTSADPSFQRVPIEKLKPYCSPVFITEEPIDIDKVFYPSERWIALSDKAIEMGYPREFVLKWVSALGQRAKKLGKPKGIMGHWGTIPDRPSTRVYRDCFDLEIIISEFLDPRLYFELECNH